MSQVKLLEVNCHEKDHNELATNPFQLLTLMEVGVIGPTGDLALCLSLVRGEA